MSKNDFYIAGIGTSAGGYEALKDFFTQIPKSPGISFVVIQHLARDYKSLTADWLSKITPINVIQVNKDMLIKPNHVYLMPENKTLKIKERKLILEDRDTLEIVNLAVDTFFNSLGNELKERAIGIIFSGAGTDGSRGVRTIKENGGLVFVQQPDSADFDSMPSVAIATDHPDLILPPAQIATKLLNFLKNPTSLKEENIEASSPSDREVIQEIINHISNFSNVNFRSYKINTIIRRLEKRTKLNHLNSIREYQEFLKHNSDEMYVLYNDLLIGVTNFFRDKEAFRILEKKVIKALFEGKKNYETVRIWVAGCATGEEAYSIAILCEEHIKKNQLDIPYKIFATDLDHRAIELASVGRFRSDILLDISKERVEKYFEKAGDFYEIKKQIRKKIIFARHNLINDPPFIRTDLITCRNLFIYLKPELQKKLLHNFNYALKPGGFLFLGANESSDGVQDLFEAVDSKWKIFRNKNNSNIHPEIFEPNSSLGNYKSNQLRPEESRRLPNTGEEEDYESILVTEYAPDCIFLNEENEVVYSHGNVDQYLQLPKKRMSFSIFNMLQENLALIFKSALRKLHHGELTVNYWDVLIQKADKEFYSNINFKAISLSSQKSSLHKHITLVEFSPSSSERPFGNRAGSITTANRASNNEILELQSELQLTKKELQFTVDELETLNEELQASNEEMHSSNEELQSTNEEIQSSNEELNTVNTELKNKIDEISALHNDITNLFNNTEIAIIFLDENLLIRKFTPAAKENFNFIENDIGRPISHLTHNFLYDNFTKDASNVLKTLAPLIKEIVNRNQQTYLMRVMPYKTEDMHIKGVVITFVDFSVLKKATEDLKKRSIELEKSEHNLKSLVNNTPDLLMRLNPEQQIVFVNKAIKREFGVSDEVASGGKMKEQTLWDHENKKKFITRLEKVFVSRKPTNEQIVFNQKGKPVCYYVKFVPEFSPDGKVVQSILTISRDITKLKNYELTVEEQNKELKKVNVYLDNFVHVVAHDLRNPIGNLKLLMNIYYKTDDIHKKIGLMDKIEMAVRSLDSTVNGLIDLIEVQNKTEGNEKDVFFKDIFEKVNNEYGEKIKESGAKVVSDFTNCPKIKYVESYLLSIMKNLHQ